MNFLFSTKYLVIVFKNTFADEINLCEKKRRCFKQPPVILLRATTTPNWTSPLYGKVDREFSTSRFRREHNFWWLHQSGQPVTVALKAEDFANCAGIIWQWARLISFIVSHKHGFWLKRAVIFCLPILSIQS